MFICKKENNIHKIEGEKIMNKNYEIKVMK